jgi:hypothetical protein
LSFETSGGLQAVETDDTNFATSSHGFILFADEVLNTVFVLQKKVFAPGEAYTAADGGPSLGRLIYPQESLRRWSPVSEIRAARFS